MNVGAPYSGPPGGGGGKSGGGKQGGGTLPQGQTSVVLHVVVVVTIISQVVNVHPVLKLVTVPICYNPPCILPIGPSQPSLSAAPIISGGAVLPLGLSAVIMAIAGLVMTFACSGVFKLNPQPLPPGYQSPETPAYKDGEDGYKDGEDGLATGDQSQVPSELAGHFKLNPQPLPPGLQTPQPLGAVALNPQPLPPGIQAPGILTCGTCGTSNPASNELCASCGNKLQQTPKTDFGSVLA